MVLGLLQVPMVMFHPIPRIRRASIAKVKGSGFSPNYPFSVQCKWDVTCPCIVHQFMSAYFQIPVLCKHCNSFPSSAIGSLLHMPCLSDVPKHKYATSWCLPDGTTYPFPMSWALHFIYLGCSTFAPIPLTLQPTLLKLGHYDVKIIVIVLEGICKGPSFKQATSLLMCLSFLAPKRTRVYTAV